MNKPESRLHRLVAAARTKPRDKHSMPVYTFSEDASNAVVSIVRAGGANGAVTVQFATANGTATLGKAAKSFAKVFTGPKFKQQDFARHHPSGAIGRAPGLSAR